MRRRLLNPRQEQLTAHLSAYQLVAPEPHAQPSDPSHRLDHELPTDIRLSLDHSLSSEPALCMAFE